MNDRIIWREVTELKPFNIPEGYEKCSACYGSGRVIKIYRDPGPNEYMSCLKCWGKGYIKVSVCSEVKGENKK